MTKDFHSKVYTSRDSDEITKFYADWVDSYENEVTKHGYVTPQRYAEALRKFTPELGCLILDFGCGTGMLGVALKSPRFYMINGIDISADMLTIDREKIYRKLL
ncbi:MAG: hypothetical protein OXC62_05315 [Aestuariivita sp.]|nr:hypothetical protein [Aestuariivita sp.]